MLTQKVIPECVIQTLAPNQEMKQCWDQTIGVNNLKRRILAHMQVSFEPPSLFSWHRKHHGGKFSQPRYNKRILLIGAPGTGKTTIAKGCVDYYARLVGCKIYFVELGLVRSKFVGEPSKQIKRAFEYLSELSEDHKVVFFIDEFDSVGASRGIEQMHDDVRAMVNTLISEMNKLNSKNVFTIAVSNFEGYIDHAVKRRFDFVLYFRRPPFYQRVKLFRHLLKSFKFPTDDVRSLARKTKDYTQDDITRVVCLSMELAFYQDEPLTVKHLLNAGSVIKPTGAYDN